NGTAPAAGAPTPMTTGEVLLLDPAKATHDSFLMQMPTYAGDQRVGRANQNFTRPASPQADWLLDRVRNFLGTAHCWFMPLLCGLGEMAAGAAHEMNNPLMVISGRAQLLAAKITDPGMKAEASLIAQQADRLSQIITDMMEFAKPVTPKMAPLDIAAVIDEAV